ncbi:MAG: hypothetical protein M1827_006859 [Pycnora praestabilis]|nr:MAG: hypothetical protein M1827_006859 [Pycnora praestabilis]
MLPSFRNAPFWTFFAFVVTTVKAQSLQEFLSFGQLRSLSSDGRTIPGWQTLGEPDAPQLLSDRIVLTPVYPGNRRAALWTQNRLQQKEWTAEFEFRASGQERGGGNLQLWYTKEGQAEIGTSSIYTIGRFDGLVLVIDMYGGRGGGIRGFLNDGSREFRNQHVDSLAFGHCDYSYRNLGRPSRIQIKQTRDNFEVLVDDQPCFKSDNIKLPTDNHFGISAASAENPDSFEVYKFLVRADTPAQSPPPSPQQEFSQDTSPAQDNSAEQLSDVPASSITSQDAQFVDLHNRLQVMSHQINRLTAQLTTFAANSDKRHGEMVQSVNKLPFEQMRSMDSRLQSIERTLQTVQKDVEGQDYQEHLTKLQDTMRDTHSSLLRALPESMSQVVSKSAPRMGFFIFLVIVFQLLLAGSYVIYKRRRANAPKKYL